jgi:hypothetical protein
MVRCNRLIAACSSAFADEHRANDVIDFFKNNLSQDAIQLAEKAAAIIQFRAQLKAKELPVIDKWIETKSGGVTHRGEAPSGASGAGSFSEINGKFSSY